MKSLDKDKDRPRGFLSLSLFRQHRDDSDARSMAPCLYSFYPIRQNLEVKRSVEPDHEFL